MLLFAGRPVGLYVPLVVCCCMCVVAFSLVCNALFVWMAAALLCMAWVFYVALSTLFKPIRYAILWLIWLSGNGIGRMNKVKLCRAWSVLVLVTTFRGSAVPVFFTATQLGHSFMGWCDIAYLRWFRPLLGKKQRVVCSIWLAIRLAGILAYCVLA